MAVRKFGSRHIRFLALKAATQLFPSLRQKYPCYPDVLQLTESGGVRFVREEQRLQLSPEEAEYAKRFDPPLPAVVQRSIALIKLSNATVLGSTGAVIDEQRGLLFRSRYTTDRFGPHATYHDFIDVPSTPVSKPDANYFSMVDEYRGHRHFFHFLFDRLPRIFYLLSRLGEADKPWIIPTNENLPGFQQDIYRFLAQRYPNLSFVAVPERERWLLPTLHLIDDMQPVRRTFLPPDAAEFLRELVIGGYGLSPKPPHRRLYINRSDARKRSIRNEAEIWPSFARRGFESIAAGTLSFREQVALFSEAEMIAGPHGAGFSSLLFAPEGTKVLEISNVERVKSVYFLLSKTRRQHYLPVVGSKGDRNEWFRVEPQQIEAALSTLEKDENQ